MKLLFSFLLLVLFSTVILSCKKYLDEKPSASLATPSTLKDLQALLDQYTNLNNNNPTAGEASADNYYLLPADYNGLSESQRLLYIWDRGNLFPSVPNDWSTIYRTVYVANTVLHYGSNLPASSSLEPILGQAYFWRAFSFQKILFTWANAYDAATASTDLGIPLRLNIDFNEVSVRASLEASYQQVIRDLQLAAAYLPDQAIHVLRPSRPAAYSLLARTYLSMRNYDSVWKYANLSLQLRSDPQNYNDTRISTSSSFAFSVLKYANTDILFHAAGPPTNVLAVTRARIDSFLYASYASNDLRRSVFFRSLGNGTYGFKGSYEGGNSLFGGVTVGETLLMRAEAAARKGDKDAALADLNALLLKRWKTGTFTAVTAASAEAALAIILQERRKETLYRGLRWMDIKRLNKEGYTIRLRRLINNTSYELEPNSPRFALPIPEDVIALSGMPQNPG